MQNYNQLLAQANAFIDDDQLGKALQALNHAHQVKPDDATPLVQMGLLFRQLGDADGAVGLLHKAAATESSNAFILLNLGIVQYENDQLEEADASLTEAVNIIEQGVAAVREDGSVTDPTEIEALRTQCDELERTADQVRDLLAEIRKEAASRRSSESQPNPTAHAG